MQDSSAHQDQSLYVQAFAELEAVLRDPEVSLAAKREASRAMTELNRNFIEHTRERIEARTPQLREFIALLDGLSDSLRRHRTPEQVLARLNAVLEEARSRIPEDRNETT